MKTISILSLIFLVGCSLIKPTPYNRRINNNNSYSEFQVVKSTKKTTKENEKRTYFHFDKINTGAVTSGTWLLHGGFKKFNLNGILLEKGQFKNGLKVGVWNQILPDTIIVTDYSDVHTEEKKRKPLLRNIFKKDSTKIINDSLNN